MTNKKKPPKKILLNYNKFTNNKKILYKYILTNNLKQSKIKNINI